LGADLAFVVAGFASGRKMESYIVQDASFVSAKGGGAKVGKAQSGKS